MASPAWKRLREEPSTPSTSTGLPIVSGSHLDRPGTCCAFGQVENPTLSFEEEEEIVPLPPELQQREGSLPAQRGAGTALGHPGGKGLPRQLPERGLEICHPQEGGSPPQQFKAPTDSRQPHPPGAAERGRPGSGGGGTKATSGQAALSGFYGALRETLGTSWGAGPHSPSLVLRHAISVCTCTTRAVCSATRGSSADRRWGWAKACTNGWGLGGGGKRGRTIQVPEPGERGRDEGARLRTRNPSSNPPRR